MKKMYCPVEEREALLDSLSALQAELQKWLKGKVILTERVPDLVADAWQPHFVLERREWRFKWGVVPYLHRERICKVCSHLQTVGTALEIFCLLHKGSVWGKVEHWLRDAMLRTGADRVVMKPV